MSIADKLTTIAENIPKVYEAGKAAGGGGNDRYDKGYADGQQAETDRFWNVFQQNGERTSYSYAFRGFPDDAYNPKYPIKGVMDYCFSYRGITDTVVDLMPSGPNSCSRLFYYNTAIKTVRKIVSTEDISYGAAFMRADALENITFEGVIGNDIDFTSCTLLTVESLLNIIEHLKDLTDSGVTRTLALGADNLAKLTDAQKAIVTEKGWTLA